MKNMTKLAALASAAALMLSLAGCGAAPASSGSAASASASGSSAEGAIQVSIVQPMSHTSLDQIRETIISELEAAGRSDIQVSAQNANGDTSALATILQKEKANGADIIVPIATSAAQSAKSVFEGSDTPIVFAAVSDPVAAGLTGDDCANITGVSNNIPSAEIVKLISNFQPDYQKIGFLYTSSEPNSVSTITGRVFYLGDSFFSLSGSVSHSFQIVGNIIIVGLRQFPLQTVCFAAGLRKLLFRLLQCGFCLLHIDQEGCLVFTQERQRIFHSVQVFFERLRGVCHGLDRVRIPVRSLDDNGSFFCHASPPIDFCTEHDKI